MKDKRLIYIFITVVLLGVIIVALIHVSNKNKEAQNIKVFKSNKWDTKPDLNNKHPYGLYIFKELVKAKGTFNEFNLYSNYKLLDSLVLVDNSTFMFIGDNFYMLQSEIDKILESVNRGNDLFLSVNKDINPYLLEQINAPYDELRSAKRGVFIIDSKRYDQYCFYENDSINFLWRYFDNVRNYPSIKVLSTVNLEPTFIRIPHGKGFIYIHHNPIVFYNFQLLRNEGKNYLKHVLNHIKNPKIQWLTFAQYKPFDYNSDAYQSEFEASSLLSELFKTPAFRWAFILGVFGIVLYFLFRSKRRQPFIPAVSDIKNTGYGYVKTLSGIYYSNNNPKEILAIMRANFYSAVLDYFYIDISKREDNKPLESLSQKSNVELEKIEGLVNALEKKSAKTTELSRIYNQKRDFYLQSGIWDEEQLKKHREDYITVYRNRLLDVGTMLLGFFMVIGGFLALAKMMNIGVGILILGTSILIVGIRSYGNPAIKITADEVEITPILAASIKIRKEMITSISLTPTDLVVQTVDGVIRTYSISQIDENELKRLDKFINRIKND